MTKTEIDTKFEIAEILVKHLDCDTSKVLSPLYDYLQKQLILSGVGKSVVCGNCDGWGYTVDENGRRKEHCNECE